MTIPPDKAPQTGITRTTIVSRPLVPARKGRHRVVHTVSLIAASLAGAPQFAGAEETSGTAPLIYQWRDISMAAQKSTNPAEAGFPQRVVFIHGTPGSAGAWENYLAEVPDGFEFIAVDRAGFGDSGPDDAVTSLRHHAEAIAPLLDERGTIVVGHSLGGPVAAMLGILKPDAIRGLIIVAGSLDPSLEEIHFMQPVGEWWGVRHLLPRMIRNANLELMALEAELVTLGQRLSDITVPVEIIHGTEDNLTPFANVAYMKATMVNAPLNVTVLEGQNHFLPWNAKDHIDAAIRRVAGTRLTP